MTKLPQAMIDKFKKVLKEKSINELRLIAMSFDTEYGEYPCKELYDYTLDLIIDKQCKELGLK